MEKYLQEELNLRKFGKRNPKQTEAYKHIEVDFENDQKTIDLIERQLKKNQEITEKMVHILNSFDNRVVALQRDIENVHEETTRLQTVHNNIEKSIVSIDEILEVFGAAQRLEPKIKEGIKGGLDAYLESVDKILEAMSYLNKNKNFKSSEKAIGQLKILRQLAVSELDREFNNSLSKHSLPLDLKVEKVPETFEVMKTEGIDEIKKIVKRLVLCGTNEYLQDYKEKRSKQISTALRKLSPEKIIKDDGIKKGTHLYIHFMQVFITLLKSERGLATELLPTVHIDSTFAELISNSLDIFNETGEAILKLKRNMERGFGIFALLNIGAAFHNHLPRFIQVLKGNEEQITQQRNDITELAKRYNAACLKCVSEFENYAMNDVKPLPPDGTVHELTSNICVFLQRLFEYKTMMEQLWSDEMDNNSSLAVFTTKILKELNDNLASKANKEKKSTLATVFLLNNYYYIQKALKESELHTLLAGKSLELLKEYDKNMSEQRDIYKGSWKSAISYLQIDPALKGRDPNKKWGSKEKKAIKQGFKGFNDTFTEQYNVLKSFFISEPELRNSLVQDTNKLIIEPYMKYYESFANAGFSKKKEKYVKFTKETLQSMLSQLFIGDTNTK